MERKKNEEEEGVKKEYVRKESDWIKNSHLEKMERERGRRTRTRKRKEERTRKKKENERKKIESCY